MMKKIPIVSPIWKDFYSEKKKYINNYLEWSTYSFLFIFSIFRAQWERVKWNSTF